jgi:hypothetical protein
VFFEHGLGFALITVVSVLGTWPPAIHHHKIEAVPPSMRRGFILARGRRSFFGCNALA